MFIAGSALSIGSSIMGYRAQSRQARQQAEYNEAVHQAQLEQRRQEIEYRDELREFDNARYRRAIANGTSNYLTAMTRLGREVAIERENSYYEMLELNKDTSARLGRASVMASAAGVELSNDVIQNIQRSGVVNASRRLNASDLFEDAKIEQLAGIRQQSQSYMDQYIPGPSQPINAYRPLQGVTGPSPGAAMLNAASGVVSSYASAYTMGAQQHIASGASGSYQGLWGSA